MSNKGKTIYKLGPTAKRVLKLVKDGLSNADIGKELDIGMSTTRRNIKSLRAAGLITRDREVTIDLRQVVEYKQGENCPSALSAATTAKQ